MCLDLHHVDGLDREALEVLASSCPHLAKLGFNNCDFQSSASIQQVINVNELVRDVIPKKNVCFFISLINGR